MSFMTCFTLFSLANAVEWPDKKNSYTKDYSFSLIFITQEFLWFRCFLCLYFLSLVFSGWTRLTQLCVHEKIPAFVTWNPPWSDCWYLHNLCTCSSENCPWDRKCDKNLKRKQEKPCIFIWKLPKTLNHIPSSAVWRLSRWPLRTMITSQAPNENWKCIIKYKYIYQRVEKCEVPSRA